MLIRSDNDIARLEISRYVNTAQETSRREQVRKLERVQEPERTSNRPEPDRSRGRHLNARA